MQSVGLVWVERERLLESILGGEHPLLHQVGVAERHESLSGFWIERGGAASQRIAARNCPLDDLAFFVRHAAAQRGRKQRRQRVIVGQQRGGGSKIWVAIDGPLEERSGGGQWSGATRARGHLGLQEIHIGFEIASTAAYQQRAGICWRLQRGYDAPGNLFFKIEYPGTRGLKIL